MKRVTWFIDLVARGADRAAGVAHALPAGHDGGAPGGGHPPIGSPAPGEVKGNSAPCHALVAEFWKSERIGELGGAK